MVCLVALFLLWHVIDGYHRSYHLICSNSLIGWLQVKTAKWKNNQPAAFRIYSRCIQPWCSSGKLRFQSDLWLCYSPITNPPKETVKTIKVIEHPVSSAQTTHSLIQPEFFFFFFFQWPETKRSPGLTTAIWIPAITGEKCWKQSTLAALKPFRSLHFIRKSLISAVSSADKASALMQTSQSSSRLRCSDA